MLIARKIVLIIFAAVFVFPLFQNSASAAEKKVKFKVDGIT